MLDSNEYEVRVMGLDRCCKSWKLNPKKILKDSKGRIVPQYTNAIIANCGTCLYYPILTTVMNLKYISEMGIDM